jgi:hypothetical protein
MIVTTREPALKILKLKKDTTNIKEWEQIQTVVNKNKL